MVVIALPGSDSRMLIKPGSITPESLEDSMANLVSLLMKTLILVLDSQLSSLGTSGSVSQVLRSAIPDTSLADPLLHTTTSPQEIVSSQQF